MQQKSFIEQLLVKKQLITHKELESALKQQALTKASIDKVLIDMQLVTEDELYSALSEHMNIPFISLAGMAVNKDILNTLTADIVHRYNLFPVKWDGNELQLATSSLDVSKVFDEISKLFNCKIRLLLATPGDIGQAVKTYYESAHETISSGSDNIISNFIPIINEIERLNDKQVDDASIVHLVDQILINAFENRATDVHFEPYKDELRIRYRIDGVLYSLPIQTKLKSLQSAIVSRIKVIAGLDISERRLPQDGRMTVNTGRGNLDLRVSTLPTPFGESVQVRVFSTNTFHLADLGFSENDLQIIESVLQKPHGLMFVTGPTGSGKTTTLYACLHHLNTGSRKIITIEDPIEFQVKGITQVQVNPPINFTFARALRSMLRHDADIMLVGEVRDPETANIAINIALTGHLLLSTLHANDAAGTFTRLFDMGIEPHLIASSVEYVIAQNLVRVLCPHCKVPEQVSQQALESIGFTNPDGAILYTAKGCAQCQHTGYYGQTTINEHILVDNDIRKFILKRAPAHEINRAVIEKGGLTMRQNGFEKVKQGITSIKEVLEASY